MGFCRADARICGARAALLSYEEPCLTGENGSGAVFFSGCNMGCIFCQNHEISREFDQSAHPDWAVSPMRLSDIFLSLQEKGAATINLVTPTHYVPALIPALEYAKGHGLTIPVIYNTGSYERAGVLQRLEGLVDIYLPDLKFCSEELAVSLANAPHYFDIACAAIKEMVRQCPVPVFADGTHSLDWDDTDDSCPLMVQGVIVRHMALPGCADDSEKILSYLYYTYGDRIFISLMNQYTPMPAVKDHPYLSRPLSREEYDSLCDYAVDLGISNGFLQEGGTVSESFVPIFDGTGIR